jgi:hypothetical protein
MKVFFLIILAFDNIIVNSTVILQIKFRYFKVNLSRTFFFYFLIGLLFICAYKAWVISPPCPHPLPYHPLRPLPLPTTPSIPGRNYFGLISNFADKKV